MMKRIQEDSFVDELGTLQGGGTLRPRNKLSPLSPFVDAEGILRVGGRIENANVPHNAKHQLILPKDHPVTKLLIVQEHCSNAHAGREHVLAGLCEQYWVVNARSAVKGFSGSAFSVVRETRLTLLTYLCKSFGEEDIAGTKS